MGGSFEAPHPEAELSAKQSNDVSQKQKSATGLNQEVEAAADVFGNADDKVYL